MPSNTAQNSVGPWWALILLITVLFCFPSASIAAQWELVPKIAFYGGYDNNIFFSKEDKRDSTIVNIQPALKLDYRSLLSGLNFTADFDILRYLDESDLDRVNQDYKLDGWHELGERLTTRGAFKYRFDSTQNTYLEETGRLIEILDREYLMAEAGMNYALTNVSFINATYRYQKAKYEDDIFPNFSRHRLNLYYRHRLKSERDYLTVGPSFYHRTNDLNDTDYVSIDLGWERRWSDITRSIAAIGARYTTVDPKIGEKDTDWGVRARVDLTHQGLISKITFKYFHDLRTTAQGEDVNVDNFYLRYHYFLTQRVGLGVDGRLVFSYALFEKDRDQDNTRYYEVRPFMNYQMTRRLNTYLNYSYQNSSQDLFGSDETRSRHRVWVELRYEFPSML